MTKRSYNSRVDKALALNTETPGEFILGEMIKTLEQEWQSVSKNQV